MDEEVKKILEKYKNKLKENIETIEEYTPSPGFSREYQMFREDALTKLQSFYERICNGISRIIQIKPKEGDRKLLQESIETIHLQITPEGAASLATFFAFLVIIANLAFGIFLYIFSTPSIFSLIWPLIFILIAFLLIKPITNIPNYMASRWRLRASNQMVLCILYIVMYMRHTSNLEHAIKFASDHVGNPLALDLRKVFWDIETGRFSNIKESLDFYLVKWRHYNLEFVEAFHLIEGSLYEASEDRRVTLLEKALEVILNGTYEKMLHYAQGLKNPITMLHMLGIVLPILGLVILPLMGSLVGGAGSTKIFFLFLVYNIALPIIVYFLGMNILSKRPTGYSETDLIEQNPDLAKYKNILFYIGNKELKMSPFLPSFLIFAVISLIGLIPLLFFVLGVPDFDFFSGLKFLDYRVASGLPCVVGETCYGPFGAGAVILSLFFPLGIALGIGNYYRTRSKKLIKIRNETKKLELEFGGSLFQLGNRIADGIPVEVGFGDVADNMEGTPTGDFFRRVNNNIRALGMSVKEAIFNKNNGAIWFYPSSLIESSMKVLIESARKGPQVVAKSLLSISTYVDKIRQVNERLKDLLSEIISSMKSQISFLTPVIAGIVVGISSMIITILSRLSAQLAGATTGTDTGLGVAGGLSGLTGLFEIKNLIPSYYLQLIIGLYVVEIIIVLTILANGIENGADDLNKDDSLGKNLFRSSILYFFVALIVTLIFTFLAVNIQVTG